MIAALQRGAAGTASSGGAGGTTAGRSGVYAWGDEPGCVVDRHHGPPTVMVALRRGGDGRLSAALRHGGDGRISATLRRGRDGRLMVARLEQVGGR
jgi:hypothetical protein